jgi:peptidoglycan hydrolase-like protein with peptidoglycan-binding domain
MLDVPRLFATACLVASLAVGCSSASSEDRSAEPSSSGDPSGRLAFVVTALPDATVGVFYFYDFCGPGAAPFTRRLSLIQCSPTAPGTPSGGHPPYHFQLDSGVGFPPIDLHLQKDGVLNGMPKAATRATFRVCAVDLDANQACRNVSLVVRNPPVQRYRGTWQVDRLSLVCPSARGTWEANLTITDDRLKGTWRDSYHGNEQHRIDVPMRDGRATWTVGSGEESITLTGTFDGARATVRGTLVGPVCTTVAGRWRGTFEGDGPPPPSPSPSPSSVATSGRSFPAPTPAPSGAWTTVQPGDRGANVRAVQLILQAHGYSLAVDGIFGPETSSTVRAFQASRGLPVDAMVRPDTWSALIVTVKRGDTGAAVKAAQYLLNKYGCGLAVDGIFGPATQAKTRSWQEAHGLAADGIVGTETWARLTSGSGDCG